MQKTNHNKTFFFALVCAIVLACTCLFACGKEQKSVDARILLSTETSVVFTVENADEGATLLDAMYALEEQGELTFEVENGQYGAFMKGINGVENGFGDNPCWISYTSDTALSNTAWGTYEYGEQTLGSTVVGMSTLTVKVGEIYAWVYTQF